MMISGDHAPSRLRSSVTACALLSCLAFAACGRTRSVVDDRRADSGFEPDANAHVDPNDAGKEPGDDHVQTDSGVQRDASTPDTSTPHPDDASTPDASTPDPIPPDPNDSETPDGMTFLYQTTDGVFRWDGTLEAGTRLTDTLAATESFNADALSPDGDAFVLSTQEATFYVPVLEGEAIEIARPAMHEPRWLPDGERIFYLSPSMSELYVVSSQGGEPLLLHSGSWLERAYLTPSPDSSFIAIQSNAGAGGSLCGSLAIVSTDAQETVWLFDAADNPDCTLVHSIAWSHDGRFLAIPTGDPGLEPPWGSLSVFDTQTGETHEVLPRREWGEDPWIQHTWSPREAKLAYIAELPDATTAPLHLFDPVSGTDEELLTLSVGRRSLFWHPGGDHLFVTDSTNGLWQIDAESLEAEQRSSYTRHPTLDPSGNYLALSGSEIEILEVDSSVSVVMDIGSFLAWAPDGSRFAYIRRVGNDINLYFRLPNGQGEVRTGPSLYDEDPGSYFYWYLPDLALDSGGPVRGSRLVVPSTGESIVLPQEVSATANLRLSTQQAICTSQVIGGTIDRSNEEEARIASGTAIQRLRVWWRDDETGELPHRTIDERVNHGSGGSCFVP